MPRRALSNPATPFHYEAQDLAMSVAASVADLDLGPVAPGINGVDISGVMTVTTTVNALAYLRINNANLTGAAHYMRGFISAGALVAPETGRPAGVVNQNQALSGLVLATTDFNHVSELWFHGRCFLRAGQYRHSITRFANLDSTSVDNQINGQMSSTWNDAATVVNRLGFRLGASSGFTAATIRSLVVRSF